jgi:hypothetical protein
MKLCLERVQPRCQERPVTFSLPSLAAVGNGEIDEPSPQNVSRAMNAVMTALACGEITPGEAATLAAVYRERRLDGAAYQPCGFAIEQTRRGKRRLVSGARPPPRGIA